MAIVITTNDGETQKDEVFKTKDEIKKPAVQEPAKPEPEKNNSEESANEETDNRDKTLDYLNGSSEEVDESDEDLEDDEDEESEQKPKKSGFKKRIDKLTKEKTELKNRLEMLEAKFNGNNSNNNNAETPAKVEPVKDLVKPKLDDFDNYDDFNDALVDYKFNVKHKEFLDNQYKEKVSQETEVILSTYNKKVEEAKKFYGEDKWEKIKNIDAPITYIMQREILESEIGPHITYYLANNPNECKEISALPVNKQIKRLDAIEKKLAEKLPKNGEAKKTSSAPAPVKPISNSSAEGKGSKDPSQMSFREHKAKREAEIKKRNG